MTEREASRTAMGTAYLRAAHQVLDASPLIFEDPMALTLLGKESLAVINSSVDRFQTPESQSLRSHVVLRSRFAEDCLQEAAGRGVTQYVILGAGMDTFALRQPAWARPLRILEVDHAGTQARKRALLAAAGLELPPNAAFADIDFAHETLLAGLLRSGLSLDQPTFFSWLGVTMYLERSAIESTLRAAAAFAPGSGIVLTFMPPEMKMEPGMSQLAEQASELGEPFVSFFTLGEMEALLLEAGFNAVEFLTPEEARARYYASRPDGLQPPRRIGIVSAIK